VTLKQNVDRFMKVGHTSKTSPTQELNQDVARQSGSWRQAIFNRVVTPNKNLSGKQLLWLELICLTVFSED
jgi:TBC1 domain-containing protein 4